MLRNFSALRQSPTFDRDTAFAILLPVRARKMSSESPQLDSATSAPDTGAQNASLEANGTKRKPEQTNGAQMRSKRNRYISIAWWVYVLIKGFGWWADINLATNASVVRSSAMDKCHVRDVDTLTWSVCGVAHKEERDGC